MHNLSVDDAYITFHSDECVKHKTPGQRHHHVIYIGTVLSKRK